ncbi:MAG: phage capsid protein, partial [candidate division WOR-3 bacterium]
MNVDALIPHFSSMLGAQLELQQRASILRGSVIEERIAGKDIRHVIPGKRELKDKIYKHQMLTPNEGSFRWRKVESVPAYDDVWLSREDEIRSVLVNYGQSYAESFTAAVGRKIDERIISGLMGTAYEGTNQETFSPVAFDTSAYVRANKTGGARLSSTSPTWEAMNEGRTCLAENENDMSFVTFVTTNRVWERFVADGPNGLLILDSVLDGSVHRSSARLSQEQDIGWSAARPPATGQRWAN